MLVNTIFATIQLLIGLGIAFRPTVRLALAGSVAWSLGVWWFGEGLGGVLAGTASPVNGAPGAVILYALLAVLLWPGGARARTAPFVAAQAVGARAARALWLVLIAVGVYLPRPAARAALVLAIVVAAVIWVVGEAFGMILAAGATDPNSGLLLILLALAYWPSAPVTAPAAPTASPVGPDARKGKAA